MAGFHVRAPKSVSNDLGGFNTIQQEKSFLLASNFIGLQNVEAALLSGLSHCFCCVSLEKLHVIVINM